MQPEPGNLSSLDAFVALAGAPTASSTATRIITSLAQSRHTLIALVIVLAGSAAVRLYTFRGFTGLDDAEYARFAWQLGQDVIRHHDYDGPAVFPLRVGVIVPTALLFRVFGLNEWAMVLYPLLLSLCAIGLVYVCASHLFGRPAGLVAAGLMGMFPWDIESATKLHPDLPSAFFAAAAVTGIMLLERHAAQRRAGMFVGGLGVGLLFGLSWLCKETVAYLAPFCLIWMLLSLRKSGWRSSWLWTGVVVGSAALLIGEMITYRVTAGDYLFRLHETERNYRQWDNSFFTEGSDFGWNVGESYGQALRNRLLVSGPRLILFDRTLLFLPLMGLVASLYGWRRRDSSFLLPSVWLCTLVLMFNFGSSSTTSYLPLALFHRYLYPIFFPAIVLASGFWIRTIFLDDTRRPRAARQAFMRWVGLLTATFVLWTGSIQLARSLRNRTTWLTELPALREWIKPETVAYADALTLRALDFAHRYPARTAWTELTTVDSPAEIPSGSVVLINRAHIEWLDRNAGMWVSWPRAGPTDPSGYRVPPFYERPPPSWTLVWRHDRVLLYQVNSPPGQERAGNGANP